MKEVTTMADTKKSRQMWRKRGFIFLFLAPTMIAFAVFYLYPIITVLFTSFCKWDYTNITSPEFFGFKEIGRAHV